MRFCEGLSPGMALGSGSYLGKCSDLGSLPSLGKDQIQFWVHILVGSRSVQSPGTLLVRSKSCSRPVSFYVQIHVWSMSSPV